MSSVLAIIHQDYQAYDQQTSGHQPFIIMFFREQDLHQEEVVVVEEEGAVAVFDNKILALRRE